MFILRDEYEIYQMEALEKEKYCGGIVPKIEQLKHISLIEANRKSW